MNSVRLGLYEKALPSRLTWEEKFQLTKELGFQHFEFSVDESDEKLARLDWKPEELAEVRQAMLKTGMVIQNIMLSGHRRFPLGSLDSEIRSRSLTMLKQAVDLAVDLGARSIQLAGYDVFYEERNILTREYFVENLQKGVHYASNRGVMLSIETMDDPFLNSISKILWLKQAIHSPWLQVYPDLGNISAWSENDIAKELELGIDAITSIHLKDTLAVTNAFPGKFKNVPFGSGVVDFKGCLKTLQRLQYAGSFTVEMWSGESENYYSEVLKAKSFFDDLFEELDWSV